MGITIKIEIELKIGIVIEIKMEIKANIRIWRIFLENFRTLERKQENIGRLRFPEMMQIRQESNS